MLTYYGTQISPNQIKTVEGFLICENVPIARTGEMTYTARDLMLDGDPDRPIIVNRYEADVFDPAAVASFEGKLVTDGHPPENLAPETAAPYARGHVQNVRRVGEQLVADLHIFDAGLISDIQNGVKREVSCGYTCCYAPDGDRFKQTQIRGNHVAVVPAGRAGHEIAIQDEKSNNRKGVNKMGKFAKELLKVFGTAAKDASPEELDSMAEATVTALDAEPAKMEAEDVMVERAPKGDDLGSKLDRIISMLEELGKKNDREEKKLADEGDLDKEIARLEGGETLEEKERAVMIPAEEMEDVCKGMKTGDALSAAFLRRIRPAVAAIESPVERARVVDALLSSVRGNDMAQGLFSATQDAARAAGVKKQGYEALCEAQKAEYDRWNPHKKND